MHQAFRPIVRVPFHRSILPTGARCAKVLDLAHARVEQRPHCSNQAGWAGPRGGRGGLQRDETHATHGDPPAYQGTPCVWQSLQVQCMPQFSLSGQLTEGRAAEQCWCPDKESRRGASAAVLVFLGRRARRRATRATTTNTHGTRDAA